MINVVLFFIVIHKLYNKYYYTMKTNLIPFLLTIVFSQLFVSISAQNKEGFQSNLDSLSYYQYEKVFLHIDRNIYSPGSDIWYKAYLIDDYTFLPSEISNNLHVELISPEGKIIQSNITFLYYGFGTGDFHLSDSLPGGQYTIRAYTNFMRNFDDLMFFTQKINVKGFKEFSETIIEKNLNDSIDFQFMPEGGSFIQNVASKVAFKAINPIGNPVNIEGVLFNDKDKLLNKFSSVHDGMGIIQIQPKSNERYYVKLTHPDSKIKYWLPDAHEKGICLTSYHLWTKNIELLVSANPKTFNPSKYRLLIHSRGILASAIDINMDKTPLKLEVDRSQLPAGISTLTIVDEKDVPLVERLIYNPEDRDFAISITSKKEKYNFKEKVTLNIETLNKEGEPISTNLSLAVVDQIGLDKSNQIPDIYSYLFLNSNFRGKIQNPSQYFKKKDKQTLYNLDLVLLTHGWRQYIWKEITNTPFTHNYDYEQGFSFTGKVNKLFGKRSISEGRVTMYSFLDGLNYFETKTDSAGCFAFNNIFLLDTTSLVVQAFNQKEKRKTEIFFDNIEYVPPVLKYQDDVGYKLKSENTGYYDVAKERKYLVEIAEQKNHILIEEVEVKGRKPKKDDGHYRIYSVADHILDLDNLTNTPFDVVEALRGRFAGVDVTGQCPDFGISMRGGGEPLIVLDGMPLQSGVKELCNLNVSNIEKIEILKGTSGVIYGSRGGNGVIVVFSKKAGARSGTPILLGIENIKPKAYQRIREFYAPNYEPGNDKFEYKDLRTTIHWEPVIITDTLGRAQVSFYTAERETKYVNIIQGISGDGKLGFLRDEIKVVR